MGNLVIENINRNVGALSQQYRIEYKGPDDIAWTAGPTLSYYQAQAAPAGLLPLIIVIDPTGWSTKDLSVRIVTVCGPETEVVGDTIIVNVNSDPCE
jgi:hypothetical protein